MSIILSCGHREDDFDKHHTVMVQDYTKECTKAIAYKTVCAACKQQYKDWGILFEDQTEALLWLTSEESDDEQAD